MTKAKLNLVIDGVMLLCMAAIAGIGLLIKFVLVPGQARWAIYGRNVELYFMGLDRHQWGTIHLVIGLVLIGLLVLHVVLHWSMILAIYRRLIPQPVARRVVAAALVGLAVLLALFWCVVEPEVVDKGRGPGLSVGADKGSAGLCGQGRAQMRADGGSVGLVWTERTNRSSS